MKKELQNNFTQDKRERFKRLATHRTNEILKRLRILGNCSNKHLYDYKDEEVKKIFIEIRKKVDEIDAKFKTTDKDEKFKL